MHNLLESIIGNCPDCGSQLVLRDENVECEQCQYSTHTRNNVLFFSDDVEKPGPHQHFYNDEEYLIGLRHLAKVHQQHYTDKSLSGALEQSFRESLLKLYKPREGLKLEIGCGAGSCYETFAPLGDYLGVDINASLLGNFKKAYPDANCIGIDITQDIIRTNSVETIFCLATLEHIFYLDEFLLSINRILKDDGCFYVMIPTEGGLFWEILRQVSSLRFSKKRDGFNYGHFAKIEHCNNAATIDNALRKFFIVEQSSFFPFAIPSISFNFCISYRLRKRNNVT